MKDLVQISVSTKETAKVHVKMAISILIREERMKA